MSSRPRSICLALAAGLALGACGRSADDAPPAPTRASYIAKTDALCKASNTRTRKLNRELQQAATGARDDADRLRRFAPILRRGYGAVRDNAVAFRAAVAPPADEARVARISRTYDQQAELAKRLAAAAARGDSAQFRSLSAQQRRVIVRARRLARAYGFEECGSSKSDAAG